MTQISYCVDGYTSYIHFRKKKPMKCKLPFTQLFNVVNEPTAQMSVKTLHYLYVYIKSSSAQTIAALTGFAEHKNAQCWIKMIPMDGQRVLSNFNRAGVVLASRKVRIVLICVKLQCVEFFETLSLKHTTEGSNGSNCDNSACSRFD